MLPSRFRFNRPERASRRALLLGSLAVALSAASLASPSGRATQYSKLPDQVPAVVGRSQLVGHADPNQVLHVNVCLQPPNMAALQTFVDMVSDPTSPNYRQFLTPAQIGSKFGQPTSVVAAVVSYLKSQGLSIKLVADDNLHVMADGTVSQVESALQTTINRYHASPDEPVRTDYFSYAKQPSLPAQFAATVQHVSGLENFTKPKPRETLTPSQSRQLYNIAPEFAGKMYGQGRTAAISNFDGYRLSNVPLFYSKFGLPAPSGGVGSNITVVTIDGGSGSGTPGLEGDLDIQMVLGQAPQCNFIIYDGGGSLIDVLTVEEQANKADDISESYGWFLDSGTAGSAHTLHVEMSAEGITYMAAAGDSGTQLEPYSYPDYDPEPLLVGGSAAQTDSQGNRQSEVAWDGGGSGWSTTSATFNQLPSWQKGNGVPTNINARLVPDIASHAAGDQHLQLYEAYYLYFNGSLTSISGTSCASPITDGQLAVAEQKLISLGGLPKDSNGHQRFGRIQDVFYKQNMRSDVWYDITVGDTGQLPNGQEAVATKWWDFCSGLGAINWDGFVKATFNPPVTIAPNLAKIYGSLGQNPTGSFTNLGAEDGLYYTINSVSQPAGQTAAALIGYTMTANGSTFSALSLNLAAEAPQGSSVFIYEYIFNPSNNSYTLYGTPVATQSMNGTDLAFTVQLGAPASVSDGTELLFVARALYPTHLGNIPFTFKIDQATLTELP